MTSFLIISGAVLGGIGILAGTLSAHVIANVCSSPVQARNWEMALRSWLFHSLVLIVTGALSLAPQASAAGGLLATAGLLFLVGTILFSGCLAALAISGRTIFAAMVPLGSLVLFAGWMFLVCAGWRIE